MDCRTSILIRLSQTPWAHAMIDYELNAADGILTITPKARLSTADFDALSAAVDEYIVEHGALTGIMICIESFPGWEDFGALISHLKFVRSAQQDVNRVAAVTDSAALSLVPKIGNHFVSAEVRHFDSKQQDDALAWLRSELSGEYRQINRADQTS